MNRDGWMWGIAGALVVGAMVGAWVLSPLWWWWEDPVDSLLFPPSAVETGVLGDPSAGREIGQQAVPKAQLEDTGETGVEVDCDEGDDACLALFWVNEARAEGVSCGAAERNDSVSPLRLDSLLEAIAEEQADYLADWGDLAHTTPSSPIGETLEERLIWGDAQGWRTSGETLYRGSGSARKTIEWWLESGDHCPVLMDARMRAMGVGVADSDRGVVWVAVFGGR